jgi:hypothetical protein
MNALNYPGCRSFPCLDVNHDGYVISNPRLDPEKITLAMVSEAAPQDPSDYYYAGAQAAFEQSTLDAFKMAGLPVNSFQGVIELGVYLTSAVKCAKIGYGIKAGTIKQCSLILEEELQLYPNLKVIMLMGDVAIKALNYIALRCGEGRVVPAGSTYKIRGGEYFFQDIRVFPSYLQVGPSYGIEKSKQRMIVEDIQRAFHHLGFTSPFDNSYSSSGRVE